MSELLNKAICYATEKHANHGARKNENIPYIIHPLEVATIAAAMTDDERVITAGFLHDVVEDTNTKMDEIKEEFGDYVAFLVSSETENKRRDQKASDTWKIRKEESIEFLKNSKDINVKILWVSDKLANMRSIYRTYMRIGDKLFESFNNKNKEDHKWYYQEIINATKELSNKPEWKELNEKFKLVFNGGK